MAGVTLTRIKKTYGDFTAVEETDLNIVEGELLALLGPSGCGKTTTLRMIAGFVTPTSGDVAIGKNTVTSLPIHKRKVGMVFQGYALFPHLNVADNITFGLKLQKWDKQKTQARLNEMLQWVRLEKYVDRYPKALSGGQQQRVALARAMANKPEVLLLDEPFSALDAKLRTQMRSEIRALQQQAGITSVFVTHDQEEAMAIADRIGVMNQGRLEQVGSAQDLYLRPASRFVASFIGKCNVIEGKLSQPFAFEATTGEIFGFEGGSSTPNPTAICFRPEHSWLSSHKSLHANSLPVTLKSSLYLGPLLEFEVADNHGNVFTVNCPSMSDHEKINIHQKCYLNWNPRDSLVLT